MGPADKEKTPTESLILMRFIDYFAFARHRRRAVGIAVFLTIIQKLLSVIFTSE